MLGQPNHQNPATWTDHRPERYCTQVCCHICSAATWTCHVWLVQQVRRIQCPRSICEVVDEEHCSRRKCQLTKGKHTTNLSCLQTKIWRFFALDIRLKMKRMLNSLGPSEVPPRSRTSLPSSPDLPMDQWLPQAPLSHPHQDEGLLRLLLIVPPLAKSTLVCLAPCKNQQRRTKCS